jgi:hypothetical protein
MGDAAQQQPGHEPDANYLRAGGTPDRRFVARVLLALGRTSLAWPGEAAGTRSGRPSSGGQLKRNRPSRIRSAALRRRTTARRDTIGGMTPSGSQRHCRPHRCAAPYGRRCPGVPTPSLGAGYGSRHRLSRAAAGYVSAVQPQEQLGGRRGRRRWRRRS